MPILAIDTSTSTSGVALLEGTRELAVREREGHPSHSRRLLPMILDLCADADVHLSALSGLAVAAGPGSFTGLRVGLATANGLAWALDRPVVGVSSLEAFAWRAVATASAVVPILDARRGEVFIARFAVRDGHLEREIPDQVGAPSESFRRWVASGDTVLGDGAARYSGELAAETAGVVTMPAGSAAVGVGRAAAANWAQSTAQRAVAPVYLRRPHLFA